MPGTDLKLGILAYLGFVMTGWNVPVEFEALWTSEWLSAPFQYTLGRARGATTVGRAADLPLI